MFEWGLPTAARLASLASGRGGLPAPEEWPWIAAGLLLLAVLGTRLLLALGLSRLEAFLVAGVSPALVLVDAPLGTLAPGVALAANMTGCLLPIAVGLKVSLEGRAPRIETFLLLGIGIVVAYLSSQVVPGRGVLLQYRIPALVIGVLAAGLLHQRPEQAGAAAFAAGALAVLIGADLLRLRELAEMSGAGRVILGGAGLLDGILLVALLSAAIAASLASLLKFLLPEKAPSRPTA